MNAIPSTHPAVPSEVELGRQLLGDVQSTQRLVEPQRLVDEEQEVFGQDLPLEQVLPRHAFDAVVVLRRRHSESQRG